MSISDDISLRISHADQIARSAINATTELAEVFENLSSIRAPQFIPNQVTTSLPPATLTDNPTAPDETRIASAEDALSGMANEIAVIDDLKSQIDRAFLAFDSTFSEVQARIPAIMALSEQIVIPQSANLAFEEGDFREGNDLDAVLKSIIEDEIQKGGDGYSDTAEAAMRDMGSEMQELDRQAEIDDALDNASGTGFPMPQGHHYEAVRKINEKYRLITDKQSGDAMLMQTKISLDNKWRALNAGITYNQIMLAYFDAKAQRALDAAIAVLNLEFVAIKYRTDMAKQVMESGKSLNAAELDRIKIFIERYGVELIKYRKQIEGLMALAKGYTDQYRVKGQIYGAEVSAAAEKSALDQAENKFALENQKMNILAFIASAEEALRAFISTAELKLGAADSGAKMQKSIAMSSLDSLGTIVNRIKTGELNISGT